MGFFNKHFPTIFPSKTDGLEIEKKSHENSYIRSVVNFIGNLGTVWRDGNDHRYIKDGFETNIDVFSVISYIAEKAGSVPWRVMERKPDGTIVEMVDPDHPMKQLLKSPNKITTWPLFVEEQVSFKLINGNRYMYGIRPFDNDPVAELWTMSPEFVEVVLGSGNEPIEGYRVTGQWNKTIPAANVVHGKTFNPRHSNLSFVYGMSPLKAALLALQRSNESWITSYKMFKNQGAHGALVADGEYPATPEEHDLQKKQWLGDGGSENAGGVQFFPGGKVKWLQFGLSAVDLDVLASQGFDLERFCNVYRMPVMLFNQDSATFSNQKEARKAAWTDAIIPELNTFKEDLNKDFGREMAEADGRDLFYDYDLTGVAELQVDKAAMIDYLTKLQDRGVYSANEVRSRIGDVEIDEPGMDERRVRLNSGRTLDTEEANEPEGDT